MEQKTFSLAWHFPENSFQADSAIGIGLLFSSITADINLCSHRPLEKQGSQPAQQVRVPSRCVKWTPLSDRRAWWRHAGALKDQVKTWPTASLTSSTTPKASVLFWVWFLMFLLFCFVYLQREQIKDKENHLIGPLGIAKNLWSWWHWSLGNSREPWQLAQGKENNNLSIIISQWGVLLFTTILAMFQDRNIPVC